MACAYSLTHSRGARARRVPTVPPAPLAARTGGRTARAMEVAMLWTIFVILVALWLLGVVSSYTLGGFIHLLLVLAIVVVLIRLIQGRSAV